MAALVAAINAFPCRGDKAWMAGTSPTMTPFIASLPLTVPMGRGQKSIPVLVFARREA
jgi:hypothetical protein